MVLVKAMAENQSLKKIKKNTIRIEILCNFVPSFKTEEKQQIFENSNN